jgi:superfamily I DNA/RNA helicase
MIYKYFGPPGTGKTHKLISRAKAYIKAGTPLHKIGYFAFTRKAAEVSKKRMPADG